MTATHAPEPWHVSRAGQPVGNYWADEAPGIAGANGRAVAEISDADDSRADYLNATARRIVACVNACAGIETEALERVTESRTDMHGTIILHTTSPTP